MKKKNNFILTGVLMLGGALNSYATEYLPTNDFFTDGQTWHLERITGTGDDQTSAEIEVRVDGEEFVMAEYNEDGKTDYLPALCKRLVVKENDEEIGTYMVYPLSGKILVKSDKKNEFVALLDFNCGKVNTIKFCSKTYDVTGVDYIFTGNLLRKRVKCNSDDSECNYVYGVGAKEWSLSSDYWPDNSTYKLISMTTAEGVEISPESLDRPKAECDNKFWTQDKRWDMVTYYPLFPEQDDVHRYWKVDGELTLGQKEGEMVCPRYLECNSDWEPRVPELSYAVVSLNDQVYQYDNSEDRFLLVYDFNVEVGDQAERFNEESVIVNIDEITVNNRKFKRIIFAGASEENVDYKYWVEGIGANGKNKLNISVWPTDGSNLRMDACYQGNECIFTYDDFSGSSGVSNITTEKGVQTNNVYDLHGRIISEPKAGTIVISQGKKHIAN